MNNLANANSSSHATPARMVFRGRFGALVFAIFFAVVSAARADVDSESLFDECIAGINANLALIEHGVASYRVKTVSDIGPHQTQETTVKVFFEYPRRRTECTYKLPFGDRQLTVIDRRIIATDARIHQLPPLAAKRAEGNVVEVAPNVTDHRAPMDPRQQRQNWWAEPPSFASEIARMRRIAPGETKAERERNGLIKISFQPPFKETRGVYWLSPRQGYGLVRANEWVEGWNGTEPSSTYEAELKRVGNGAFVVAHRHEIDLLPKDGALAPFRDEDVWLEEIDLDAQPPEKTFTIDGLDLPVGARILDKINGREYRYRVDAVGEEGVKVGKVSGPLALRWWLGLFNTAVAALLLVWLGNRLARWRDRHARRNQSEA